MRAILTAAALGVTALATLNAAQAADFYYVMPTTPPPAHAVWGTPPSCDSPHVLARLPERLAYYDAHVIHSGVAITTVDAPRETGLKAGGPSLVDRRYCSATAVLSNGTTSEVVYIIEGPKLGVFSIGWHVESCLPGYDPYRVYDARCRSIRPY